MNSSVWGIHSAPIVTALTALMAYALALQLDQTYALWAPLTVLIILQPTKGASFYLAFQRLVGTLVGGALAAALTNLNIEHSPLTIVLVFTLITAFFTWFACIGRLINGYAFQVAGFTTITVYMISYRQDMAAATISTMRIVETVIGVSIGLLSLVLMRKQGERNVLKEEKQKAIEDVRLWVRTVLQEGESLESRRLNEKAVTQLNSLDELSTYASSERFFIGNERRKTLYLMGNLYTILSYTRTLISSGEWGSPNPNRTEEDIPELRKLFESLERPVPNFTVSESPNWRGGWIAFLRTIVAGIIAGTIWYFLNVSAASTFFLVSLVHICMLSTVHQPIERYKDIIISEILSFFVVAPFLYFYGPKFNIEIWAFILFILPGTLFSFLPKWGHLGVRITIYCIVMYAICSRQENFSMELVIYEYIAFLMALFFAIFMTMTFMPQRAHERYSQARRYLFYGLRKISLFQNPIDPRWMMVMYSDIERMLFYAKEIKMDEPAILDEGLSVIDISVEILELRSLIASMSEDIKKQVSHTIAQITNLSLSVDERVQSLQELAENNSQVFDDRIMKTLSLIAKKIKEKKSFFEQKI